MNQTDRLALTKCIQNAQAAFNKKDCKEAEKYFTDAAKQAKVDPGLYILALYLLATFHCTQKNYDEAERLYKECIPLSEAALFPFHYYLAELYKDIGVTLLAAERYDDAKEYFEEALERLDKPDACDELHVKISQVLLELSKVHLAHQNFDEAEACIKRTIAYAEKDLLTGGKNLRGTFECSLASRHHDLCKIFIAQKRYKEAEDLCKLVLSTMEKRETYIRPPALADALFTMADIHDAQNREAEAKLFRKRANDLMETWFEPEQSAFEDELERCIKGCLRALKDEAVLAQSLKLQISMQARQDLGMKRHAQAEQCFRRLLKMKEELVGPHHLDILRQLDFIVVMTLKQQKYAEAEATCLRQLQIAENNLGKNHFVVADKLKWIAAIKICQREFAEAEPFYARSYAITENLLYPDSWLFAHCLTTFAELREMQGQEKEADDLNQIAYRVFSKAPAANQRFYPTALFNIPGATYPGLPSILEWSGDSQSALALLIKTLNSREESLGAKNQNVGTTACRLAQFYWETMRLSEAEKLYLKAVKIFATAPEPNNADQLCCNSALKYLLQEMKRYEEADMYDEELNLPESP